MMFKVAAFAALASVAGAANLRSREVYEGAFADHLAKYGITLKDGAEFVSRLQTFADNFDYIEQHNSGNSSYKMALNEYSHLTLDEFHAAVNLGGIKKPSLRKSAKVHTAPEGFTAADSVDWSTTPAVSPVKNQGSCGSCWSFSATGGLEGAYYAAGNTAGTSLSEQNLVSCDNSGDDQACNGGWMDSAFEFAQSNGGLCSEADYPYVSGTGNVSACSTSCTQVPGTAPSSWTDVN
jgi:KDEL-tailed cysteine endopeptidase